MTPQPAEPLVTLPEIEAAADRLRGITLRTPLLPFGRPIDGHPQGHPRAWLKPEMLQPIGAFKLRGAYNALASLTAEERARGVVTHSSGNHAQGIARSARLLGMRAVVVMPDDAPAVKIDGVRADGAEIDFVGASAEERAARADELAARDGLVLIPSYDDRRIIAGQGTAGIEIVEQLTELGYGGVPFTVVVPVGGGGLISGVATAVKSRRPEARVLGVEPELAADARESLHAGHIVRWGPELVGRTAADGMRTNALGRLTFPQMVAYVDDIVTVSEIENRRAMARGARMARLVLEPSGATTLAAWLFHAEELPPDGPVVVLLSGGNVDAAAYAAFVAEGQAAGG